MIAIVASPLTIQSSYEQAINAMIVRPYDGRGYIGLAMQSLLEVSSWSQGCCQSTANHIGSWCDDTALHIYVSQNYK